MNTITVSPDDDLQSILSDLRRPTAIFLKEGIYRQKLTIPPLCVKMTGERRETTIITNSDYAKKPHEDGHEYNTFRTYTVCVTGGKFALENITIQNACPSPEVNGQCVALSVNCKQFYAKGVNLVSTQDTLFCAPFPDDLVARYSGLTPEPKTGETYYDGFIPHDQLNIEGGTVQVFENCKISGTVDFIFGGGESYFYNCDIVSLADKRGCGFVAAPSHPLCAERGFSFISCKFTSDGAPEGSVYLARPWRDFGKCSFLLCTLDRHISASLFNGWDGTYREKTARFAYYGLGGVECAPVGWARELTKSDADDIINTFLARKEELLGE